jgi:hypothetical protein
LTLNAFYRNLGEAKSRELYQKYSALWSIYDISHVGGRSRQVGGIVPEGIARDFIRDFLLPKPTN